MTPIFPEPKEDKQERPDIWAGGRYVNELKKKADKEGLALLWMCSLLLLPLFPIFVGAQVLLIMVWYQANCAQRELDRITADFEKHRGTGLGKHNTPDHRYQMDKVNGNMIRMTPEEVDEEMRRLLDQMN